MAKWQERVLPWDSGWLFLLDLGLAMLVSIGLHLAGHGGDFAWLKTFGIVLAFFLYADIRRFLERRTS